MNLIKDEIRKELVNKYCNIDKKLRSVDKNLKIVIDGEKFKKISLNVDLNFTLDDSPITCFSLEYVFSDDYNAEISDSLIYLLRPLMNRWEYLANTKLPQEYWEKLNEMENSHEEFVVYCDENL